MCVLGGDWPRQVAVLNGAVVRQVPLLCYLWLMKCLLVHV